jgi:hypothetical protein
MAPNCRSAFALEVPEHTERCYDSRYAGKSISNALLSHASTNDVPKRSIPQRLATLRLAINGKFADPLRGIEVDPIGALSASATGPDMARNPAATTAS